MLNFALISCLGVLVAAAPPAASDEPLADETVRQLLQDRNYTAAVEAIDKALLRPDATRDQLLYHKGCALSLQKQYDAAVAVLNDVSRQFPQSPWARRARFAAAGALARKGDFKAAEVIYRAEAETLVSADRRHEFAGIYLEYADAFFKPSKKDQPPDYAQALEFYKKASEIGPKPETRLEVELLVARCQQELGKAVEAVASYEAFIQNHRGAAQALEARYRLGQCQLDRKEPKLARRVWQDLLADHSEATSDWVAQASFRLARTWALPQPESDEHLNLGVAALEDFLKRFPLHKLAGQAHVDIARSFIHRGQHEEAVTRLTKFLADQRYRDREEIPHARNLLGQAYQTQKKFAEALAAWREYLAKHPADAAWSTVQRSVVDTEYLLGLEEFKAKKYDAARQVLGEFLNKYPLDRRNPGILFLFGQIQHAQRQWDAAIAEWRRLVSKHPQSNESSYAQYLIAQTLEQDLGKPDEALEEYRNVKWGDHQAEALEAVARLTSKTMSIATERVFRSGETPVLKVTTRNIPAVSVRVYQVNLEAFFRKTQAATNVEHLDVALIDPNATFEFPIPKYAKYQQLESSLAVPLPDKAQCGAVAVTVSSDTLEATTLVLLSDLDLLVKTTPDEVFVFAENMRTGQPWPGVRLLLSDGKQVFAEEVTGHDGVFRKSYEELQEAGDVRVFALAAGHAASNITEFVGRASASGLSDKGYVYTDRPAYRAGQRVFVRGCIRRAAGEQYRIEKGKRYSLWVSDPRDRLLWQQDVVLGEFGSFHADFPLPATSPPGDYRVQLLDENKIRHRGTFHVEEYKLEPVRLNILPTRRVYYRGEEIEGTIRAEYNHGAPLAGRVVTYKLADDRQYTATTDDRGEIRFKLPTREFSDSQVLPLQASLAEWNVQATVNLYLAAQSFAVSLSTARTVYVADETFEVTVTTQDAQGQASSQPLKLRVLELSNVEGQIGERQVAEHAVVTAAADGVARQTLKLPKGGRYRLRAVGTDRLGNLVTSQLDLSVSDDQDRVRLRILADRQTYQVGDTADVTLHWREQPALAVVTFQGVGVLDYRLVELKPGANRLPIVMTPQLAPNFELAAAVMTDTREAPPEKAPGAAPRPVVRFHEASSPFTVHRNLKVSVSYRPQNGVGTPRPGEPLEVTVTAVDPQGKPVAAELSLAMVEQALLQRFPWPLPPIHEFFEAGHREPAVRTSSSITFAYRPETKSINPLLLSEQQRLELAEQEAASRRQTIIPSFHRPNRGSVSGFGGGGMGGMGGMGGGMMGGMGRGPGGGPGMPEPEPDSGFDSLVELIESTTAPQTWGEEGWTAADLDTGLDLVVSQTGDAKQDDKSGRGVREAADPAPFLRLLDETGYWNPAVVTGPDGKATLVVAMPERTTAWTLVAKAITRETLAGETSTALIAKKDLFGQLKLPSAFTDGDEAEIVASVHNDAVAAGTIEVTLSTRIAGRTLEEKRKLEVTAKGVHELPFKVSLRRPEPAAGTPAQAAVSETDVAFRLTVAAGERQDVTERRVPLQPYGLTVFATAGGSADANTTAWVEAPPQMAFREPRLQILIQPTLEQSLLDTLLAPAPACQREATRLSSGVEATASDLLAAVGLQKLLGVAPVPVRPPVDVDPFGPSKPVAKPPVPAAGPSKPAAKPALGDDPFGPNPPAKRQRVVAEAVGPNAPRTQPGEAGPAESGLTRGALDIRIRTAIATLLSAQNEDGGWSWNGLSDKSDRCTTARAVWALSLARGAGYNVGASSFDKAVQYLTAQIAATDNSDRESKTLLLHALSVAGHGDFALANRLYRERPALSTAALLHLALAFTEMDRKAIAGELLALVAQRKVDDESTAKALPGGPLSSSRSPVELRALWALAVQATAPQSPQAKDLIDWLLAHRTGHRWAPDKATGPATLALCRWFGDNRFAHERYRLTVQVNSAPPQVLEFDKAATSQVINVPAGALVPGKQRVQFQLDGRGRYAYQVILAGFVPAEQLKSTTDAWKVERTYEPAHLEREGRQIARGFDNLQGEVEPFRNPLTQLPVGRRGLVSLRIWRSAPASLPDEQLEYLVITEPLPSGTAVVEQSVSGPFERCEIGPGAITFYVGNHLRDGVIQYALHGYLPGSYHAAPTVVRDVHRPQQLAVSAPKPLTVLPSGQASADAYRLSPQELFELGKLAFQQRDWKTAVTHLNELVSKWNVTPEPYKEAIVMLLDAHLELREWAEVVRNSEIIHEKWPDQQISFAKSLQVGAAYHEMGEFERSYLVFRTTIEGNFTLESGVAGFLAAKHEFLRSVAIMGRLVREYPLEPYVATAHYALAQQIYGQASHAAEDAKLRQAKINRVDLLARAWRLLEVFLTTYPEDPAADQVAFSAANVVLELEKFAEAAGACEQYARRYPASTLLDSYWYIIGYCRFAQGQSQPAAELLRKVAEYRPVDPATGRQKDSANKWPALYILAQIYHSLGKTPEAIQQYRLVEDHFPDAKKSIEYFLRKDIRLPEVTTVRPGKPVELPVTFRNLSACEVKVYRIDLLKYALLRQDFSGITQINLAGIQPQHEATVALGEGPEYRDRVHTLALPLKNEGAFLVVCRGDSLFASGLVLLSPLEVEVQHDPGAREVRATVKDVLADRYLNEVQVKITGSGNADFVSGVTDRRGLFVAQGIMGSPTVIAQAGPGRYAFHRGQPADGLGGLAAAVERRLGALSEAPPLPQADGKEPAAKQTTYDMGTVSQMERRIRAALLQPTSLTLNKTPLEDVVKLIEQQHRIPVRIDRKALDNVGVGADQPTTGVYKGMTLRSALRLLLKDVGLTYNIRDEILQITSTEEAEKELLTKIYIVSDLVRCRDKQGEEWADYDTLIDTIMSTVAPQTWDQVGGPGSIQRMTLYQNVSVLVVSQTQEIHEQIEDLLKSLRSIPGAKTDDGPVPTKERPPTDGIDPFGPSRPGQPAARPSVSGARGEAAGNNGLLKGLQDTQHRLQGRQVEKLQRMYNQGMGGMGGGVGGMGGMF